jgi:hypothetical protein
MRSVLFLDLTQHIMVVSYRRFGTICWAHLQGQEETLKTFIWFLISSLTSYHNTQESYLIFQYILLSSQQNNETSLQLCLISIFQLHNPSQPLNMFFAIDVSSVGTCGYFFSLKSIINHILLGFNTECKWRS